MKPAGSDIETTTDERLADGEKFTIKTEDSDGDEEADSNLQIVEQVDFTPIPPSRETSGGSGGVT